MARTHNLLTSLAMIPSIFYISPPHANAQAMYRDFRDLCILHIGDPAASLDAGARTSWSTVRNPNATPVAALGISVEWVRAMRHFERSGTSLLVAGMGALYSAPTGRIPVSFCAVLRRPVDPIGSTMASSWAAVQPALRSPHTAAYTFQTTKGQHYSVPQTDLYRLLAVGVGEELVTMDNASPPISAVMVMSPRK